MKCCIEKCRADAVYIIDGDSLCERHSFGKKTKENELDCDITG